MDEQDRFKPLLGAYSRGELCRWGGSNEGDKLRWSKSCLAMGGLLLKQCVGVAGAGGGGAWIPS
jgi:hypothetical protein